MHTADAQPTTVATRPLAIVTGSGSGMGAGLAPMLARDGFDVLLVGRTAAALAPVATQCEQAGARTATIAVDLTTDASAATVVEGALQAFGRIDALVHCAGIYRDGPLESFGMQDYDDIFAINVRASFRLTAAASPHLPSGGSVLFVGSNVTAFGRPLMSAYSASKAAVEDLARSLAVELGPRGIRVNAVSPGITRTEMTEQVVDNPELQAEIIADTPLGRVGEVADLAATMAFLCSPGAAYMSGSVVVVDGARHLR